MRFQKKYKLFNKLQSNRSTDLPVRILKFKHTKWNSLKFYIRNRKRLSYFFRLTNLKKDSFFKKRRLRRVKKDSNFLKNINIEKRISLVNLKIQSQVKKWERFSDHYKDCLNLKRHFFNYCDSNVKYKRLKKYLFSQKNSINRNYFFKKILRPQFRIDILLYKLRLCKSSFESRVFLNNNQIKVNSKNIKGNYFVKAGDVIKFDDKINFDLNLKRIKKNFLLHNFLEIDFYTGTIVILRSFDEISMSELPFFIKGYFDIDKFRFSFN